MNTTHQDRRLLQAVRSNISGYLQQQTSIVPLVVFRVGFGLVMLMSTLRFVQHGWIKQFYIDPSIHFTYLGFGWVTPLNAAGMYTVFALMAVATLGMTLGFYYRISVITFFLLFTYVELIDKSYYLNHYYFVSVLSFLMIFLPLNRAFSFDVTQKRVTPVTTVPAWTLHSLRLQLTLVYVFAGIAKLEPDWLLHAQPLSLWLRAKADLPLIGHWFDSNFLPYAMSWAGAAYDLSIPFLLLWSRSRYVAYALVIFFHAFTALLFPIGMFPWIMMTSTLVFFSGRDYQKLKIIPPVTPAQTTTHPGDAVSLPPVWTRVVLVAFIVMQLLMPLRHFLYPGPVLWTEEGFRFSWRVMLVDKQGAAFFTVLDPETQQHWTVFPGHYLSAQQERQMAYQPDMILQFAHVLAQDFKTRGVQDPQVFAEVYVSMNGRGSQLFIDPHKNLAATPYSLAHRDWVLALSYP